MSNMGVRMTISLDPYGREADAEVYCEGCAKRLGLRWSIRFGLYSSNEPAEL